MEMNEFVQTNLSKGLTNMINMLFIDLTRSKWKLFLC